MRLEVQIQMGWNFEVQLQMSWNLEVQLQMGRHSEVLPQTWQTLRLEERKEPCSRPRMV